VETGRNEPPAFGNTAKGEDAAGGEDAFKGMGASFSLEPGVIRLHGRWTIATSVHLDRQLRELPVAPGSTLEIDGSLLETLDSAGAWLVLRTARHLRASGCRTDQPRVPQRYERLLKALTFEPRARPEPRTPTNGTVERLFRIGRATVHVLTQSWGILGYLGRVTVETGELLVAPRKHLRLAAIVHQIEECGISALPIVGLLAFLVGVVLAYQGADQLKRFGAEIFTINLLCVGVLRELGGLITAIIVAGRSGSAFTAHLGSMRVNEEIDAMQTMGLDTVDTLVLPRIIGLVLALPALTFFADVMGVAGGAALCYFQLDITIPAFSRQLMDAVSVNTLMVGLIKAPVFALVISLVGCYEGFQVERNAASVGLMTTRSVVESVFLVIVLDAAFSILFSVLGI
jgi:phospholipid/cholesterol/gamma-HCH transport system permease protein